MQCAISEMWYCVEHLKLFLCSIHCMLLGLVCLILLLCYSSTFSTGTVVILLQALNPFYIFQAFTCIIWFLQEYWMYTSLVMLFSVLSVGMTVYETRKVCLFLHYTYNNNNNNAII